MNIVELRTSLFQDLQNAMVFIEHKKMTSNGSPNSAKQFGSTSRGKTTYFFVDNEEWRVLTPECRVMISSINTFDDVKQTLTVEATAEWYESMVQELRSIAQVAFDSDQIDTSGMPFETFWNTCRVPKLLSFETYSQSKRGKRRIYIPLFHKDNEITGTCEKLDRGDVVKVSLRWHLCQTFDGDRILTGFRPMFAGGIKVIRRGGMPSPIRSPWKWDSVDFSDLSIAMYNCLCVRTPCMIITSGGSGRFVVEPSEAFAYAISDFHKLAYAEPWNNEICIKGLSDSCVDEKLMATIVPSRNSNQIEWTAVKHRILPNQPKTTATLTVTNAYKQPEMAGAKKRAYNMDMSDTPQDLHTHNDRTKRRCT